MVITRIGGTEHLSEDEVVRLVLGEEPGHARHRPAFVALDRFLAKSHVRMATREHRALLALAFLEGYMAGQE